MALEGQVMVGICEKKRDRRLGKKRDVMVFGRMIPDLDVGVFDFGSVVCAEVFRFG